MNWMNNQYNPAIAGNPYSSMAQYGQPPGSFGVGAQSSLINPLIPSTGSDWGQGSGIPGSFRVGESGMLPLNELSNTGINQLSNTAGGMIGNSGSGGFMQSMLGGNGQQGWGGLAIGAASALATGFMGMKQYGLAKQSLAQNKQQFETNFAAQKQLTNSRLEDRQKARVASNPNAYESVDSYMNKNGIK